MKAFGGQNLWKLLHFFSFFMGGHFDVNMEMYWDHFGLIITCFNSGYMQDKIAEPKTTSRNLILAWKRGIRDLLGHSLGIV